MKFKRRRRLGRGLLDLTPLINVFFLLLVFFIFTSSFIFQPGIRVDLPKAVTSDVVQQETVVLVVTKDDTLYLEDRAVTNDELASRLSMLAREKTGLLIKADRRASLGRIVEVWDLCRAKGVSQINIATNQ